MKEATTDTNKNDDREIRAMRVLSAPRELVFTMWTDPNHIANWFGPKGFTTTTHKMDVRPGGEWRHTMRGPDGMEYPNHIIYREVVKPERLVYSHVSDPPFQMTVTFEGEGNHTRLTVVMLFESAAIRDRTIKERGAEEGLHSTLTRLAENLAKISHDRAPLAPVIPYLTLRDGAAAIAFYEKAFDAALMFKMPAQDGKRLMHASIAVNGGVIMLSDEFTEFGDAGGTKAPPSIGGTPVTIHLEVDDADQWWQRALDAGASVAMPLDNMFWGARYGKLKDPFGHIWSIGGPVK